MSGSCMAPLFLCWVLLSMFAWYGVAGSHIHVVVQPPHDQTFTSCAMQRMKVAQFCFNAEDSRRLHTLYSSLY